MAEYAAVRCSGFTVRTSKMVFENGIKNSRTECTACAAILKSSSHFLARQQIDHLNAHKPTHPLAADVDIVGGLYVVKPLILCKLRADPVGRHGLLRIIIAPSCVGFIDRLGAGFAVGFEANVP